MPTYLDNCIICGYDKFNIIEPYNDSRINTNYVACSNCGLVVMNPMPTEDELKEYYRNNYWALSDDMVINHLKKQHSRTLHVLKYVESNLYPHAFKNLSSVLEVGSSFGVTLHEFGAHIEKRGKKASLFAIEPSENSVRIGRKYYKSVNMLGRTLEELRNHKAAFDFVILSHVLEHFSNPVASLKLVADKMAESSIVYIEVPNFYGHTSVAYVHNYCFTETSLRNILNVSKLEPIKIDLYFPNPMFPKFITCLARKKLNSITEQYVKKETVDEIIHQRKETVDEIIQQRRAKQARARRYSILKKKLSPSLFQAIKYLIPKKIRNRIIKLFFSVFYLNW